MSDGDLENLVFSLIDRYLGHSSGGVRYHERHAIVTSYDPVKYLAKVTFQPEGQESGWLPIEAGHIGESYGIAVGLQPGDGKKSGDQVIVRFQEGDMESGKVVQRVHSDDQTPPPVQSGEIVVWSRFQKSDGGSESAQGAQGGTGQQIYLKNDGTLTLTDGNGATLVMDGNGNIKINCKNLTIDATGTATMIATSDVGIKAGGNVEIKAGGKLGVDASTFIAQGGGDVSDGSVTAPSAQPSVPPFQVP